ncbi:MAG: hypothetical protein ACTSYD_02305 [Candidatus Heimdallarchaeaceae archaeon]
MLDVDDKIEEKVEELNVKIKELKAKKRKLLTEIRKWKDADYILKLFDKFTEEEWEYLESTPQEHYWDYVEDILEDFDERIKDVFKDEFWTDSDLIEAIKDKIKDIKEECNARKKIIEILSKVIDKLEKKSFRDFIDTKRKTYIATKVIGGNLK